MLDSLPPVVITAVAKRCCIGGAVAQAPGRKVGYVRNYNARLLYRIRRGPETLIAIHGAGMDLESIYADFTPLGAGRGDFYASAGRKSELPATHAARAPRQIQDLDELRRHFKPEGGAERAFYGPAAARTRWRIRCGHAHGVLGPCPGIAATQRADGAALNARIEVRNVAASARTRVRTTNVVRGGRSQACRILGAGLRPRLAHPDRR